MAHGKSVRIFDNFFTEKNENLGDLSGTVEVVRGDLRDMKILEGALSGVTHVYHQAVVGSVPRSIADPFETQTANVNGTLS